MNSRQRRGLRRRRIADYPDDKLVEGAAYYVARGIKIHNVAVPVFAEAKKRGLWERVLVEAAKQRMGVD